MLSSSFKLAVNRWSGPLSPGEGSGKLISFHFPLLFSLLLFSLSSSFILFFNVVSIESQFRYDFLGLPFSLDGLSISFLLLISFLFPILLILGLRDLSLNRPSWSLSGPFLSKLSLLFLFLFLLFIIQDLFFFYLCFEWLVFPLFFVLLKFGSKYSFFLSRYDASYRLLFFSLLGGLFLFSAFFFLFFSFGSSNSELLSFFLKFSKAPLIGPSLLEVEDALFLFDSPPLSFFLSFLWLLLFFSFLIKLPSFPFHTWLPLAHSEAPTFGSILLAAVILKLASYGLLKFNISLFPLSSPILFSSSFGDSLIDFLFPFLSLFPLFSLLFASFSPLRSFSDIKKIIAYSSIVHMNFSLFGLFSLDFSGILGGSLLIFSHAFTSSALFYLVGFLYSQFHSRLLPYFQGLSHILPIFSSFFFLFSLCNISLPFTFSFLSEFLLLSSSLLFNPIFSFFLILSLLLSSSFFFLFSSKLLFGPLSPFLLASSSPSSTPLIRRNASDTYLTSEVIYDISLLDFFILLPFLFFSFFFSLFPSSIISFLSFPLLLSLS